MSMRKYKNALFQRAKSKFNDLWFDFYLLEGGVSGRGSTSLAGRDLGARVWTNTPMKSMKKWIEKKKNKVLSAVLNPRAKNKTAHQKRNFVFMWKISHSRVQRIWFSKSDIGKNNVSFNSLHEPPPLTVRIEKVLPLPRDHGSWI